MAKVTRIKASDGPSKKETDDAPTITRKKVVVKDKKTEKSKRAKQKKAEKETKKKSFILFRPFVALGRYLHNSWLELRQVRWPNRKATWKMVLAVLVYTALFMALIAALDLAFGKLFNLILG